MPRDFTGLDSLLSQPVNPAASSAVGTPPAPQQQQQPTPDQPRDFSGIQLTQPPQPNPAQQPVPVDVSGQPSQAMRAGQGMLGGALSTASFFTVDPATFLVDLGLSAVEDPGGATGFLGRNIFDIPKRARRAVDAQQWIKETILPEKLGGTQDIIDRAAFEAGGALLLGLGPAAALSRSTKSIASLAAASTPVNPIASRLSGLLQHYGRPGLLLASEGMVAAAQGAGAEAVTSTMATDDISKRIMADVGTQMVIGLGANSTGALGRLFKRYVLTAGARPNKFAAEELGSFLAQLRQDNPREWARLTDYISNNGLITPFDDLRPTTAQITGIPEFLQQQRNALTDPSLRARFTQELRRNRNRLARRLELEDPMQLTAEVTAPTRAAMQRSLKAEKERLLSAVTDAGGGKLFPDSEIEALASAQRWDDVADRFLSQAETNYLTTMERLGPSITADDAGDLIYNQMNRAAATYDARTNAMYAALPDGPPLDTRAIDDAVRDAQARFNATEVLRESDLPETFRRIQLPDTPSAHPRTLKEVRDIRTFLIQERLALSDVPGNGIKKHELNNLQTVLNQQLEQWEDILPDLKEANARYRRGKELFDQNEAAKVLASGPNGEQRKLSPAAIVDLYWNSKDRKGARQRMKTLLKAGEVEPAEFNRALSAYARGQMSGVLEKNGTVSPKRLAAWMGLHREKFADYPEALAAARNMNELRAHVENTGSSLAAMDKNAAAIYLKADPELAVQAVLRSSGNAPIAAMEELTKRVKGDPAAEAGLRRALIGELMARATKVQHDPEYNLILDPEGLQRVLSDPKSKALVRTVYSTQHANFLDDAAEAARTIESGVTAGRLGTQQAADLNAALTNILSRVYAWESGRIGLRFAGTEQALRAVSFLVKEHTQREWRAMLEDALFNPQTAQFLSGQSLRSTNIRRAENLFREHTRKLRMVRQGATSSEGAAIR